MQILSPQFCRLVHVKTVVYTQIMLLFKLHVSPSVFNLDLNLGHMNELKAYVVRSLEKPDSQE